MNCDYCLEPMGEPAAYLKGGCDKCERARAIVRKLNGCPPRTFKQQAAVDRLARMVTPPVKELTEEEKRELEQPRKCSVCKRKKKHKDFYMKGPTGRRGDCKICYKKSRRDR